MLTSVDIHYLVGILCQVSNQDNVDVILGDQVYNEASKTERDVDITITYKDQDGSVKAFIGYEVKDHARPLDVSHVEQLCAKLKTHTQITRGNIVSSSGYTKAAKEVAEFNKIDLFELRKWENAWEEFSHFKIIDGAPFTELIYEWTLPPTFEVYTTEPLSEEDETRFSESCELFDSSGNCVAGFINLGQLKRKVIDDGLMRVNFSPEFEQMALDSVNDVHIKFDLTSHPNILINQNHYKVTSVGLAGSVRKKQIYYKPDFKILVNTKNSQERVGCMVAETRMGHLIGISITPNDRGVQMILISLIDRLKNKIFRHRLF